ncbi:UNVERIFIED_CONTAM: hypothetical protein FKN15_004718 [Acipenser sinensis]
MKGEKSGNATKGDTKHKTGVNALKIWAMVSSFLASSGPLLSLPVVQFPTHSPSTI